MGMEQLYLMLTDSARVLGIRTDAAIFRKALDMGRAALDSGMDTDTAFDLSRQVLLSEGRSFQEVAA